MSLPANAGSLKIVVLDVETTGKERATDQIIELCLRFGLGSDALSRVWHIRPSVPIHPEATGVHGITAEDVAAFPLFPDDVLVGYNVAFELDMHYIQWDESGAVVFGFGKYKGQQIAHANAGFLKWILAKDFPPHVQKICRVALERRRQFDVWITTHYPRAAAKALAAQEPSKPEQEAAGSSSAQEMLL